MSLDALLGNVAADGTDQELMGGIDFRSPLTVTPNTTSRRLEVGLDTSGLGGGDFEPAHGPPYSVSATSYEFEISTLNREASFTAATAVSVTFPLDLFVPGDEICWHQYGAGQVTAVGGGGVTLLGPLKTRAQYSRMSALLLTGNTWIVSGDAEI